MNHNYLIEIGLEEMPANVINDSIEQFKNKTADFLKSNKINYSKIKDFSTPRRLALLVENIAEKQEDLKVEAKGPASKIAKDDAGNWSKAALGFAHKNQVSPDELTTTTIKGTEYLFVKKNVPGKKTVEILPRIKEVIESLTFKTRMRWANNSFEYIRPFHWFVSLFDNEVVPFSILGIEASRTTRGHRFLGSEIELSKAEDYERALKEQYVIADQKKREATILDQIQTLSSENHFDVQVDHSLLDEVVNIVEYPTALMGSFAEKYLEIPDAVLITSMKDNQRYFYVTNANGKLLPKFVAVRNGTKDHLENVIKGNEKVLTARLEDALFFYREDQQLSIEECVERLKHVNFHDELGNIYDKMRRSKKIALLLADHLQISSKQRDNLAQVGDIYDFDLVTQMVGEFAELQGVMGEIYAKLKGIDEEAAGAIFEHYLPISAHGPLPETVVGSILAVADKLDTLLSFFSIGKIPSGSNDPYALRRQTIGIVRIMSHNHWDISLTDLFKELIEGEGYLIDPAGLKNHYSDIDHFIRDRIDQQLSEQKVSHDLSETVRAINDLNPTEIETAAQVLNRHRQDELFVSLIQNLSRVQRLFKKENPADYEGKNVNSQLFENDFEKQLHEEVVEISADWQKNHDLDKLYEKFEQLTPTIIKYFNATMINVDDQKLRENRYIQMTQLLNLIKNFGDLTQIVI
ncbi:glycine--tRNA ligase subunit beta [Xylocopilactobacillus apicola]|uniref:Glycine--tRNA ligase beta subunit n=1 Tax=Xylocopilactobacillus apicola TaxID=2932184 RepID=A0AAU9DRN0_9LACO|nr:glycine--tRNA ligase subunit beta [Xylocopilactobacillus apicola]BDR58624.1 glycine--tRNA ligase beta subunit [Xylocopilactobacillus apicola]